MVLGSKITSPAQAPGPKGWPWVGILPAILRKGMMEVFLQIQRDHGDIAKFTMAGQTTWLLSKADHAERVLLTHRDKYAKGKMYDNFRLLAGDGLVTSEGDLWKRQRKIAQPSFHHQSLRKMASSMIHAIQRTIDTWEATIPDGTVIDIYDSMMRMTLQILGETLFSRDLSLDADRSTAAFAEVLEAISQRGNSLFSLPLSIPTPANLHMRRSLRLLDEIVYGMIDERKGREAEHHDLLSMWLLATDEDGHSLPRKLVRDEVITLMLAGHETTGLGLTWLWYLLSQNPHAEASLHDEIHTQLNGADPTFEDLPKLGTTGMSFSETLRMYSPVWIYGRNVVEEDEIDGHRILPGEMVMLFPYFIHHDPRHWDEPYSFRPERFEPSTAKQRHRYAYFPFSSGPRVCIGNLFSMAEAQLAISMIARRFRFRLAPGFQPLAEPQITFRPKTGMKMTLHRR